MWTLGIILYNFYNARVGKFLEQNIQRLLYVIMIRVYQVKGMIFLSIVKKFKIFS